jgi:thiamine transporter ThiT
MPITLTLKIGVVPILVASAIFGIDLGFLAGIVHHLVLGTSYRDFVYLNCLYRQVIDKVAQQAQDIVKQGAQHPASQGRGT